MSQVSNQNAACAVSCTTGCESLCQSACESIGQMACQTPAEVGSSGVCQISCEAECQFGAENVSPVGSDDFKEPPLGEFFDSVMWPAVESRVKAALLIRLGKQYPNVRMDDITIEYKESEWDWLSSDRRAKGFGIVVTYKDHKTMIPQGNIREAGFGDTRRDGSAESVKAFADWIMDRIPEKLEDWPLQWA